MLSTMSVPDASTLTVRNCINRMSLPTFPKWHDKQGKTVACTEKVKVMQENMTELYQIAQDAFEDALLMGCDENQVRTFLIHMMKHLDNPYR